MMWYWELICTWPNVAALNRHTSNTCSSYVRKQCVGSIIITTGRTSFLVKQPKDEIVVLICSRK